MIKKMKRSLFIFIMFFCFIKINAYDFNLDFELEFFYNNYIKNDAYNYMAMQTTLTAFDCMQKIRIKTGERMDQIKFNFDGRLYLKPNQSKLDYFVDSFYFSFENGPFILYAGKQRIKWGTGYTWNPSDMLQPHKKILDPTSDLEGFYALRFEYSNDFITPSFIIAPDLKQADDIRENLKFALQLYKLIGNADFFINGIYQMNSIQTLGTAISYDVDFFVLNFEGAAIRYINIPVEFQNIFGYESNTLDWTYLIGFTKTLESKFFFSGEYYYNGWGMTQRQFNDYIILNKVAMFCIKKSYFSLNISFTWDDKISFTLTGIYGLSDKMFMLYPRIEYIENNNFNFEIGFIENVTDKDKESFYSMPVYNITSLKLKAYF